LPPELAVEAVDLYLAGAYSRIQALPYTKMTSYISATVENVLHFKLYTCKPYCKRETATAIVGTSEGAAMCL
jgi:hypothetical protein